MRLLSRLLFALVLVSIAVPAVAEAPGPLIRRVYTAAVSGVTWTDRALNVTQTADFVYIEGYNSVTAEVKYTWNSATHVTMKCWESDTGLAADAYEVLLCDEAVRPNSDCEQKVWRYVTNGASHKFRFVVPLTSPYIQCQLSSVAGAASDVANSFKYIAGVQ